MRRHGMLVREIVEIEYGTTSIVKVVWRMLLSSTSDSSRCLNWTKK